MCGKSVSSTVPASIHNFLQYHSSDHQPEMEQTLVTGTFRIRRLFQRADCSHEQDKAYLAADDKQILCWYKAV